jgi:hypothetical protein
VHVVEIFFPLTYIDGSRVPAEIFDLLKQELVEQFGGVTAYARSPAQGLWEQGGQQQEDAIVIFEVMAPEVDKAWWRKFRNRVESLLRQEEILIRSSRTAKL